MKITKDSKGVRYDILVEDNRNNAYDAEMQNSNNVSKGVITKRARYYEGMMDLRLHRIW